MTTIRASEARAKLFALLEEVAQSHEPVLISSKKGSAVLISEDDWRAIQETLYLLSVTGMRSSIVKGLKAPLTACSEEPTW